jgi:hypothetical protein
LDEPEKILPGVASQKIDSYNDKKATLIDQPRNRLRIKRSGLMKKWIFVGIGVVVVIVIAVLIFGISRLGPIIKTAVNTYGPKMTKTEVRVQDVGVSLLSGQAKLKDFYLGNPKGFKSAKAMSVKAVYVDVDEKSITGDRVIIDRVEVTSPEINYEKVPGTDNFQTILTNVKKTARSKPSSSKTTTPKEEGGKKFVIRDFIVTNGKVTMDMSVPGGSSISGSASLPDIHLKNVGEKSGGATVEEVFTIVLAELHDKIISPAVTSTLNKEVNKQLEKYRSRAGIKAEETKKEVEKTVEDTVKGLFGK